MNTWVSPGQHSVLCNMQGLLLHDAPVYVQVRVSTPAPRPVLPHGSGHQLIPPPVLAVLVSIQSPVHGCLYMVGLSAAATQHTAVVSG